MKNQSNLRWLNTIKDKYFELKRKIQDRRDQKDQCFNDAILPKANTPNRMIVELSAQSVAKSAAYVLFMLVLIYFFYDIRVVLLMFFISFLLAAALDPVIDWLQKKSCPRALAVLLVYVVLFMLIGVFITNVVSLIASQVMEIAQSVGNFVNNITEDSSAIPWASQYKPYLNQFYQTINLQAAASQIQNALKVVSDQLLSISFGLFNTIIILILTFFMTVEEKPIEVFFLSLFPSKYAKYISTRLEAVKDHIGQWLRGQLMVSLVTGLISYIGLFVLGVNYALTLSIIAGCCMVVPVMGRVFAWILTFPIVFNQSPMLSLWMSIFYIILQQIENNLLIPYIMNKAVGLSPIIIIFAMMVGGQYLGLLGLILAIPIATTAAIFVHDYTSKQK